jgi:hypothetical protein
MHCELSREHIYHGRFFLLEEKREVNVHFELMDGQPL